MSEEADIQLADTHRAITSASGFLLDWDGCCAIDNRLVRGAAEFLHYVGPRAAIVSNNSSDTADDLIAILSASKVTMRREQIVLAGVEAVERAIELGSRRTLVLGSLRMRGLARNSGLNLVQDNADVVVLLRDTRLTYLRLERAVNALLRGARLVVANPDLTHPGANGQIKPETGALLAALGACVDLSKIDIEVIGKPALRLFEKGRRAVGAASDSVVMFGDNPQTDIAGAKAMGMDALLVGPTPEAFFQSVLDTLRSA